MVIDFYSCTREFFSIIQCDSKVIISDKNLTSVCSLCPVIKYLNQSKTRKTKSLTPKDSPANQKFEEMKEGSSLAGRKSGRDLPFPSLSH